MTINISEILLTITKYTITATGALLVIDAVTSNSPVKFSLDKTQKVLLGAPLLSTGLAMIALTKR